MYDLLTNTSHPLHLALPGIADASKSTVIPGWRTAAFPSYTPGLLSHGNMNSPRPPAISPVPPTAVAQARDLQHLGEQQGPAWDTIPVRQRERFSWDGLRYSSLGSAFGCVRTFAKPYSPSSRYFSHERPRLAYPRRKPEARVGLVRPSKGRGSWPGAAGSGSGPAAGRCCRPECPARRRSPHRNTAGR
jgi:hypothetical protein